MLSSFARTAIVLGILVAIGPIAINMYLPAMPDIVEDLGASEMATQMTLMAFFLTLGVCQIIFGPASDSFGRKAPIYLGLVFYAAGSIGCALAGSIEILIGFRVLQGIGAAAVMVIPRAIVRDLHTGTEAARLMAMMMLVFSAAPIFAPLLGSLLIVPFGWRAVFVSVTFVALVGFVMVRFALPETLPPERRRRVSIANLAGGFRTLLGDWHFLGLAFIGAFGMSSFFLFVAESSFVYTRHFGLTPTEYSVAFSLNAIGFVGAAQFAARLGARFGMERVVLFAVTSFACFVMLLLAVTLAGADSLTVLMVIMFLAFACLGLVIPTTMVLALDSHGPIAGMASALAGTLQMLTGATAIAIGSWFFDGTPLPMIAAISVCAVGAFVLAVLTLRARTAAVAGAE